MDRDRTEQLWSHLHSLNMLAQQGSYTAAARRLGVSKAGMSLRIAELEREAGVALVQRTTRSVRLTEAGQRLVDETGSAFDAISSSFAAVRDLAAVPRGRLRVTAPVALARQQLMPRLADFVRAQPALRIELELSDRLSALASEGFDLAIRHTAAPPDTHVAWPLCRTHSLLVASRAYLRKHGQPADPQALAAHDCLYYPRHEQPAWHFVAAGAARAATGAKGSDAAEPARITVPVRGPFAANNSEALRDAALAGLGIALLPDFSAQQAVQSGRLVPVLPQWRPVGAFGEHIYAIRPYAAHVPRAVTVLVAWLRQAFAGGFAVPAGQGE